MNNEERRMKLGEIFGQQAEYFEDFFGPDDLGEHDEEIAKFVGKPLNEIRFDEVLDYIDKERPEIAKELNKCMTIALDALKHGRIWTTDNPLKTLVSRKDISIFERFSMYEILCTLLGLGRDR